MHSTLTKSSGKIVDTVEDALEVQRVEITSPTSSLLSYSIYRRMQEVQSGFEEIYLEPFKNEITPKWGGKGGVLQVS